MMKKQASIILSTLLLTSSSIYAQDKKADEKQDEPKVESAALPEYYLENGKLKHAMAYSNVQLGGFAGRLETTVRIEPDGSWNGEFVVGESPNGKQPKRGMLTEAQLATLAAALAEHNLAGLPAVIGSAKPVESPPEMADGASTTITIKFGDHKVVAHFADGVKVDESTSKLRQRLFAIDGALRTVANSSGAAQ